MLPDDDYLLRIGRLTYCATRLEGMIRLDLPSAPGLPPTLSGNKLNGKTTHAIARTLQDPTTLGRVVDPAAREWLRVAGDELASVARLRDALLHARPAGSAGEEPALRRWPADAEGADITIAWLDKAQDSVDDAIRQVTRVRVVSP